MKWIMKIRVDQINITVKPNTAVKRKEIYFLFNRGILRTWNVSQTSNYVTSNYDRV